MPGQWLSHYEILEKLGAGSMASVYLARDTHLDRDVALKVLPPDGGTHTERKLRFIREAKAASALKHPNIVTIHDIVTANSATFIVMEYVPGKTLDHLIPPGGMPLGQTLQLAIQIAGALASAHLAKIIHRDLKPSNIIVDGTGVAKLLDFGLAKPTDLVPDHSGTTATTSDLSITAEHQIVGTVAYMSPEQAGRCTNRYFFLRCRSIRDADGSACL